MGSRTEFLQIRVTPAEKAALRRLAERAGQDVSAWVLARVLPSARLRFQEIVAALRDDGERTYLIAELNDLLASLTATGLVDAVAHADLRSLSPLTANYLAAMVEQAASLKGCPPPAWTREVEPLDEPWFAAPLKSLRPWLLASSPVAYRRRNLFVDSGVGDRV